MNKSILLIDTPKRCAECKFQDSSRLSNSTLFGCKAHNRIVYDTVGGMEFDRHPQCPLQDTTKLLEALNKMMIPNLRYGEDTIEYKLYKVLSGEDN